MLASMTFFQIFLSLFYILTCLLLIGVILLQKGRGGGLAAAFGGGGGATSAFGAKTGDFFTWVTVGLAVVCLLTAVISNYTFRPTDPSSLAAPLVQPAPGGSAPVPAPDAPGAPVDTNMAGEQAGPPGDTTASENDTDSDFSNDDTP